LKMKLDEIPNPPRIEEGRKDLNQNSEGFCRLLRVLHSILLEIEDCASQHGTSSANDTQPLSEGGRKTAGRRKIFLSREYNQYFGDLAKLLSKARL